MLEAIQDSLSSLIYPQQCLVCDGQVERLADGVACHFCWTATRLFHGDEMLCEKCGAFFDRPHAQIPVFCRKCDDHHYDKAVAVGIYEKALAAAIIDLKSTPSLSRRVRDLIQKTPLPRVFVSIDIVVPVPLSKRRRTERGFNQAAIIAAAIAKRLNVPVDDRSLSRKLHTPIHRIGMDQKARELSVRNAFEINRPKLVKGKNVLIVDDILTSGATASNAAGVLKKNGAAGVFVFTLARAVMD
jgi:ComF family protein